MFNNGYHKISYFKKKEKNWLWKSVEKTPVFISGIEMEIK